MAGVNISNAGLTFIRYLKGVTETLNHKSKARALVQKDDRWTGSHIEGVVHVGRTSSLGWTSDGGALPAADRQNYQNMKVYRRFFDGTIQISDGAMAAASDTVNAAKTVQSSEMEGLLRDMLKAENGMFTRNGDGSVSTMKAAPSGTTLTVDDARMLWDGGTYDVYDTTLATLRGTVTISKVTQAPTAAGYMTVTTTAASPSGTINGDKLVWHNALNKCITGLDSLVDDAASTFQGIDAATYTKYSSLVLSSADGTTNRDLTPTLFRQMMAGLAQKTGNDRPVDGLKALCTSYQGINVEELYEGDLRLTPESSTAGAAISSFQSALGRVDILIDTDCVYNKLFLVDFGNIYRATQLPLGWRREGGQIFKRSDTSLNWTASVLEIAELYIKERHTSAKL